MSAEIPKLDHPACEPVPPPAESPPDSSSSATLTAKPRFRWSSGHLAGLLGLGAILLYGAAGLFKETGIYDVRRLWAPPPVAPSLADLSGAGPQAARPGPALDGLATPLRDQPPRTPPPNLPQFTIRNGEQYDFLFSVDEETLKRLGDVQGQLDGVVQIVTALNQTAQALVRNAGAWQQQTVVRQDQLQQELQAARQEIAALRAVVEELEARVQRGLGVPALGVPATAAAGGGSRPVAGWSVKATSGDRAWLRTPKGGEVTVTAGERLKTLGTVQAVDPIQGIVVLADGRVVR